MLRLYNDGFATGEGSNHRFVDDPVLAQSMAKAGWIAEGAAFCATAKATGTTAASHFTAVDFRSLGGEWEGNAIWEVMSATTRGKVPNRIRIAAAEDAVPPLALSLLMQTIREAATAVSAKL